MANLPRKGKIPSGTESAPRLSDQTRPRVTVQGARRRHTAGWQAGLRRTKRDTRRVVRFLVFGPFFFGFSVVCRFLWLFDLPFLVANDQKLNEIVIFKWNMSFRGNLPRLRASTWPLCCGLLALIRVPASPHSMFLFFCI